VTWLLLRWIEECIKSADFVTFHHKHVDAGNDWFLSGGAESSIELSDTVECLKVAALGKGEVRKLFDKHRNCMVNT
jgi:hypothetical protein